VPATSRTGIVKLFRVAIVVLALEAAHPGCAKERLDEAVRSGLSNTSRQQMSAAADFKSYRWGNACRLTG
jgi:hypothetical protein